MILTDTDILSAMKAGHIRIEPFDKSRLGSNSFDLTLGEHLLVYNEEELDCAKQHHTKRFSIPEEGFVMQPGELYLGVTQEKTTTRHHVPLIEGKSSVGRLGITTHVTAGFGDIGFEGYWTLEITVVKPIRVYAGMPIAQIYFVLPLGTCSTPYGLKKDAKYSKQPGVPMPSMMYKNFETVEP
jgi:dCTP deaminase